MFHMTGEIAQLYYHKECLLIKLPVCKRISSEYKAVFYEIT